jgi:hypothetical protein
MATIARNRRTATALGLLVVSGAWFDGAARGQIAYTPVVAPLLNGVALNVQPVVSPDRRYVRLTLSPYFNTVNGFTTYSAPVGAVGGGFGGGFGGFGGGLGGFGGFGGGFGAYGGMNGVAMTGPRVAMPGYGDSGTYLAGDYPPPIARQGMGTAGAHDPFEQQGPMPIRDGVEGERAAQPVMAGGQGMVDPFAFAGVPDQRSVRSTKNTARHQQPRKSTRRPTTAKRRR